MRWIVLIAAIEAVATSFVLIVSPSLFGRLILGAELSEPGQALGRLAGIGLFAFGLACWPTSPPGKQAAFALRALAIYNLLATVYLLYLGIVGKLSGILLWPAVALHAILAVLVVRVWLADHRK